MRRMWGLQLDIYDGQSGQDCQARQKKPTKGNRGQSVGRFAMHNVQCQGRCAALTHSVRWNDGLGIGSHMRKARIVSDLPEKTVKVGEVPRVAAPVGGLPLLRDLGAECGNTLKQCIYL